MAFQHLCTAELKLWYEGLYLLFKLVLTLQSKSTVILRYCFNEQHQRFINLELAIDFSN